MHLQPSSYVTQLIYHQNLQDLFSQLLWDVEEIEQKCFIGNVEECKL